MPDWAMQFIQTFGVAAFVVVVMALAIYMIVSAVTRSINSGTKKEDTVTSFAVSFNEERRQWQERHETDRRQSEERYDKLQAEFNDFRIAQARKEGGIEVIEKLLTQERDAWRLERTGLDEKYGKLDVRVQELEKNNKQSLARIQELEIERDDKNKIIAERDARIGVLEARVHETETNLTQETNRANTLSELITRMQSVPSVTNNTQPIPEMKDVDDTFIPEESSAAPVAAEEQKS